MAQINRPSKIKPFVIPSSMLIYRTQFAAESTATYFTLRFNAKQKINFFAINGLLDCISPRDVDFEDYMIQCAFDHM